MTGVPDEYMVNGKTMGQRRAERKAALNNREQGNAPRYQNADDKGRIPSPNAPNRFANRDAMEGFRLVLSQHGVTAPKDASFKELENLVIATLTGK